MPSSSRTTCASPKTVKRAALRHHVARKSGHQQPVLLRSRFPARAVQARHFIFAQLTSNPCADKRAANGSLTAHQTATAARGECRGGAAHRRVGALMEGCNPRRPIAQLAHRVQWVRTHVWEYVRSRKACSCGALEAQAAHLPAMPPALRKARKYEKAHDCPTRWGATPQMYTMLQSIFLLGRPSSPLQQYSSRVASAYLSQLRKWIQATCPSCRSPAGLTWRDTAANGLTMTLSRQI